MSLGGGSGVDVAAGDVAGDGEGVEGSFIGFDAGEGVEDEGGDGYGNKKQKAKTASEDPDDCDHDTEEEEDALEDEGLEGVVGDEPGFVLLGEVDDEGGEPSQKPGGYDHSEDAKSMAEGGEGSLFCGGSHIAGVYVIGEGMDACVAKIGGRMGAW